MKSSVLFDINYETWKKYLINLHVRATRIVMEELNVPRYECKYRVILCYKGSREKNCFSLVIVSRNVATKKSENKFT